MTVKTDYSRFHIHDELTAPEGSDRVLKAIESTGGSVPKFIGVVAEAPRALAAFAKMRSELRAGSIPERTQVKIALSVAEARGDGYGVAQAARTARRLGLGLDEISRARSFDSQDESEKHLLTLLKETRTADGHPPTYLVEEAREAGWSDEQLLEAIALVALNEFQSLTANMAGLPVDQVDGEIPTAA
ncbi:MAG: carboxymuconolactone decarboxylase family protein [Solirubrobacterales bacterium]